MSTRQSMDPCKSAPDGNLQALQNASGRSQVAAHLDGASCIAGAEHALRYQLAWQLGCRSGACCGRRWRRWRDQVDRECARDGFRGNHRRHDSAAVVRARALACMRYPMSVGQPASDHHHRNSSCISSHSDERIHREQATDGGWAV